MKRGRTKWYTLFTNLFLLTMKYFICLIFLCINLIVQGQKTEPLKQLKYDKIVFYDYVISGEKNGSIVDQNGKSKVKVVKSVVLDPATGRVLTDKVTSKGSYGKGTAFCFDPHCGFVYYLARKPVCQIQICLECNRLSSSVEIEAQKQGKHGSGQETYFLLDGLSKDFRKYIDSLLKKYSFSHQIVEGSDFDK
jgi:hypothetical protein